MKLIMKIFLVFMVIAAGLVVFRNPLIKMAVTGTTRTVVGMEMDIRKLDLDLGNSLIDIEGITLHNPKDFPDPVMVDMPKIYVDIDLGKALTGNILINDIRLDLKEFVVVRNKDGELNLDRIKALAGSRKKDDKKGEPTEARGRVPEIAINNLQLKIGKVVFKDYSRGGAPSVREFNLNLDETHHDIANLNAVVSLIVFKVVTRTTVGQLTNFDITGLSDLVGGTLTGVVGGAGKVIGTAPETLKNTAEGVADTLKSILGNK
jgi:hypothetical protein